MTPEEYAVKAYRDLHPENRDELAAIKVRDGWIIVQLLFGHILRAHVRLTTSYGEVPGNCVLRTAESDQIVHFHPKSPTNSKERGR